MKQKLIVIDGTDGSGKATQTKLLTKALEKKGFSVRHLEFPRYENKVTEPIKRYLNGDYGIEADKISPYAASSLYAIDRFDCFATEPIEEEIILADRYTTSNIIHQASKIENPEERKAFIDWLEDYEYNKLSIPEPDLVLFLDMPIDYTEKLIDRRSKNEHIAKDIHEQDVEYLKRSYNVARELAEEKGWEIVNCIEDEKIKTPEVIHEQIQDLVSDFLEHEA